MVAVWDFQSVARTGAMWTGKEKELLWGCWFPRLLATTALRKVQTPPVDQPNISIDVSKIIHDTNS
jgi:hypothetical protein